MRLGTMTLLIAISASLAGCSAGSSGAGMTDRSAYGYGYDAGYDEAPGSIYGYGGPSYFGVPAIVDGGYGGGTGWYRGGDSDWRQRAWRNGALNHQQAERLLQEQRNAALLRQQMLQNQAIVQENRIRSIQQLQEARMRSIQQAQEARMRSIQQAQEARAAWQKKALGQ
jgi:hypothetical protein